MTKHTPGPWVVQTHKTIRVVADGIGDNSEEYDLVIATCDPAVQLLFKLGELRANAHLIAAAPDLLSALQVIFLRVMYESPTAEIGVIFDAEMISRVQRVLNEAEGKS